MSLAPSTYGIRRGSSTFFLNGGRWICLSRLPHAPYLACTDAVGHESVYHLGKTQE